MKKNIDDFRIGDTVKIILLDDAYLNVYYRGKTGQIKKIIGNHMKGTWGNIELYPEFDDLEIL